MERPGTCPAATPTGRPRDGSPSSLWGARLQPAPGWLERVRYGVVATIAHNARWSTPGPRPPERPERQHEPRPVCSAGRATQAMNEGQKLSVVHARHRLLPARGPRPPGRLRVHNGHYGMRCFHPLGVMVGETGHWLDLALRPGNVHTAEGAKDVLLPLVARAPGRSRRSTPGRKPSA